MSGPGPVSRVAGLPLAALALVVAVVGIQVANGGGRFEPRRPADPCLVREVVSQVDGIDGLTERLVLLGVADAACRLGTTRESLTLDLARSGDDRTDAEVEALRAGLHAAVRRLRDDGTLPPVSALVDEALDGADLNGFLETVIRALPDSVVDDLVEIDDLLDRAIDDLDLRALLGDLADPDALDEQVEAAVTGAVRDVLLDRLRDLL